MADEHLNFLDETDEAPEAVETPEPEAEPEAEAPEEAPQEAEPTGEEQEAPPASEEEKSHAIPVTALMDEREKRQKAERELEDLRRWRKEQEARASQEQEKPDFYDNPEAAINQQVTQVKLQQSRYFAEKEFGADLVNEAYAYFDQHPQESQALLNHPSPFHAAVEHYKRQKFLSEVQDPDQWREQERERIRQEILAEAQKQSKPTAPPPSMAKSPSTGRDAIAPGNAFDQLLPE